jgi:hypothetical protein
MESDRALGYKEGLIVHFMPVCRGPGGASRDGEFSATYAVVWSMMLVRDRRDRKGRGTCPRSIFHYSAGDVPQLQNLARCRGYEVDGAPGHLHLRQCLSGFVVHDGAAVGPVEDGLEVARCIMKKGRKELQL